MLKNYMKIALRKFRKQKAYAFINVFGLAVGLACCLLIALYVYDEWSYDRHHAHADRIVRLAMALDEMVIPATPSVLAPLFKREFPEVEQATRLYNFTMFGPTSVRYADVAFNEPRFFFGDSTTFDVFSFTFLQGRPAQALARPNTVVLTESSARKYFGEADPMGEVVTMGGQTELEVTGVIEDLPASSHLQLDFLASLETRRGWRVLDDESWNSANFLTYVLLRNEAAIASFQPKIEALIEREFGSQMRSTGFEVNIVQHRLTDLHLQQEGAITYVYVFSAIALLISAERAKEVGVRKSVGAGRGRLVAQFLVESVLMVLLATALALLLAYVALPLFRELSSKSFAAEALFRPAVLVWLLPGAVLVGLLAGSYPAFVLSSFRPAEVLKGAFGSSRRGAFLRKGLVVFQFGIVVFLIVGTLVIDQQLRYVQEKNLGFDREHVVALPIRDQQVREQQATLEGELLQLAGVERVAGVSSLPGNMHSGYTARAEGMTEDQAPHVVGVIGGQDVVATLGMDLLAGPGFPQSPGFDESQGHVFLLNETAAQALGWEPEEAIRRPLNLNGREGEVVGVVKDFHPRSLHEPIPPVVLFIEPREFDYLLVRLAPGDVTATIDAVAASWRRLFPDRPFDVVFIDQSYDALYRAEQRAGSVLTTFSFFAILVACLGLFGLAAFTAEQRTKEIGVRKILGASVAHIILLLSKEVAILVLVGFVPAAPVAFYAMEQWLSGFAYRTGVPWMVFAIAAFAALAVALLTVGYRALRAATANPVEALRYE